MPLSCFTRSQPFICTSENLLHLGKREEKLVLLGKEEKTGMDPEHKKAPPTHDRDRISVKALTLRLKIQSLPKKGAVPGQQIISTILSSLS